MTRSVCFIENVSVGNTFPVPHYRSTKMALNSSFHIKYLSRNPKHFSKLLQKKTLDGLFQIACPCSKLDIHPLYENENYMIGIYCAQGTSVKYAYKKVAS